MSFDSSVTLPMLFSLRLDGSSSSTDCEIRHETPGNVGVRFLKKPGGLKRDATIDELIAWLKC